MGSASPLKIAFVHYYDIGQIKHHDFLQLQAAAVVGIHYQRRQIDNPIFLKWHRLLTGAHRLNNHIVEIPLACPRVAMLRMNTRSSCELIMVARSPSNAPSPTTLGSCDKIAILPFGLWFRNRSTNSSINVVLPAPPGPVKPITSEV